MASWRRSWMRFFNMKENTDQKVAHYLGTKACLEECRRVYDFIISDYDKIYDRISIVISIAGLVLFTGINNIRLEMMTSGNCLNWFSIILSFSGLICIFVVFYKLIIVLKSKKLASIDPYVIEKEVLYKLEDDKVELYWISKYIKINKENKGICQDKQNILNKSIVLIIYSVVLICFAQLLNNIGGL